MTPALIVANKKHVRYLAIYRSILLLARGRSIRKEGPSKGTREHEGSRQLYCSDLVHGEVEYTASKLSDKKIKAGNLQGSHHQNYVLVEDGMLVHWLGKGIKIRD